MIEVEVRQKLSYLHRIFTLVLHINPKRIRDNFVGVVDIKRHHSGTGNHVLSNLNVSHSVSYDLINGLGL